MPYKIVTDTSANLQNRDVARYDLVVVPFSYYMDGMEYTCLDTEAFDGRGFYNAMRARKEVTTSLVTPQRYQEAWEPILQEGNDIIFIAMSSGISGSFAASLVAADILLERYPERKIVSIDTLSASLGEGLLAIHAAEYREQGLSMEEVVDRISEERFRMCQVFTVDDLMFLNRGGRLSRIKAVAGTVLNIKPILKGDTEGKIVAFGSARGRKRSIKALAEEYDATVIAPERQVIGIAEAGCPEDAAYLEELLRRNKPPKAIMNVCYEPVTGSHVGPGALALFFMGDPEFRGR